MAFRFVKTAFVEYFVTSTASINIASHRNILQSLHYILAYMMLCCCNPEVY